MTERTRGVSHVSDRFYYTTPLDPLARPLIEELTFEYDSRYGSFYDAEGATKEMNRFAPEVFAPPHGNFVLLLRNGKAIAGGAFMPASAGARPCPG